MAPKHYRPGRTLLAFFLGTALLFGLVALADTWKPQLGLDLQGGQRITLQAKGDPSEEQLSEAAKIINRRVNASGVVEADVNTQGDDRIVVEIPGEGNQDLVEVVKRQARLGFRLIACSSDPGNPGACGAGGFDPSLLRPAPEGLKKAPGDEPTPGVSTSSEPTTSPSASETTAPADPATPAGDLSAALKWRTAPTATWVEKFNAATCPEEGGPALLPGETQASEDVDDPNTPIVACSAPGKNASTGETIPPVKYLLSAAVLQGGDLTDATTSQEANATDWLVRLTFEGGKAQDTFAKVSQELYANGQEQFAMVLDGEVLSAPSMQSNQLRETADITGNMGQEEAKELATSLKFGALPVAFADDPRNVTIGPSLAGNQLSAGIWAGVVGLFLVMLYCLLYYRGLGLVVISSLCVAGVVTVGMVLLLSSSGFTLSLPGIAGFIVAVGITADSFIVYFERIRDEMRDGKSMRVAVESGWVSARNTCLAADAVSMAAAVVLYIFAIDDVRGFAFTLGLCTLIDVVVFFWFTKPMVSFLGTFKFFNTGHPLSGLSAGTLGVDAITAPAPARRGN